MIREDQLTEIGRFNKTHGIVGEISATFECDASEVCDLSCIILDIDGIFVPFFIANARTKNSSTLLLKLDDIETENQAKQFVGKTIYALKEEIEFEYDDGDLRNFLGYAIVDSASGSNVGKIIDIEDSTDNLLFIVETAEEKEIYIPVADEYFEEIDDDNRAITMNLPLGIMDL